MGEAHDKMSKTTQTEGLWPETRVGHDNSPLKFEPRVFCRCAAFAAVTTVAVEHEEASEEEPAREVSAEADQEGFRRLNELFEPGVRPRRHRRVDTEGMSLNIRPAGRVLGGA